MEKINFTNGQAPAINDTNLNQLQTNVEDAINEVDNKITEVDDKNNYSTEEKVVGTWINGKTLYRKTLVVKDITTTSYSIDVSSLNIESISFDLSHSVFEQNAYSLQIGHYATGTDWSRIYYYGGKIELALGSVYTMKKTFVITIEYTKTTD